MLKSYSQVVAEGPDVCCEAHSAACENVATPHETDATAFGCFFNVKVPRPIIVVARLGEFDQSTATGKNY